LIVLAFLTAGLFLASRDAGATTRIPGAAQVTSTPTSTQTTSPLPTPTQTPSPTSTPTATQTPTPGPTLAPNELACFAVSRQSGPAMLLAWRIGQPVDVAEFALARAVVIDPTTHTGPIPNSRLQPPIPSPTSQAFDDGVRYTTTDTGVESGQSYVYYLDVIGRSGQILYSVTAQSPAPGAAPDDRICDPTRPTPTPTVTLTPVVFPTSTNTPTRTPTPTWTWTPTITPTPTWTPTPLPTNTHTPIPTNTFTPMPTATPVPYTPTPSPTFTLTPTFTPDIRPPTAAPTPETQDAQPSDPNASPPDTPTTPPTPSPAKQQIDAPTPTASPTQPPAGGHDSAPTAPAENGSAPAQNQDAAVEIASGGRSAPGAVQVAVDDFRPRLIPRSRASLFRMALWGVAGLAFLAALGFLLAGIASGRREE